MSRYEPDLWSIPESVVSCWKAVGLVEERSLAHIMSDAALIYGDAPLQIISETNPASTDLSYLHRAGLKLAGSLEAIGVKQGDVIAMQMPNCVENAVILQAAAALGCALLPIIHILGPSELNFILKDSNARVLFSPDHWKSIDFLDRMERLAAPPERMSHIVVGDEVSSGGLLWRDLPLSEMSRRDLSPDATALLLYTSGTTGLPKGVCHTSRTISGELAAQSHYPSAGGTVLAPWPAGHIAGTLGMLGHAALGRPTLIMDVWNPAIAAQLIEFHSIQQTSGTPFHLTGLLEAAERDGRSLRSLEQYIIGATTIPPSIVASAEAAGIKCCRCYGSTEMPTVTQCSPDDSLSQRLGTDGQATPGAELRIVDDNGDDVPLGEHGEVAVRGPDRFARYLRDGDNFGAFLDGGWFLTGDIGVIDHEGYLTITDRKKDIIIRGGENIASREVEDVLLTLEEIAEVAVVGKPDPRLGERVCAFVVPAGDREVKMESITLAFTNLGIARQKIPEALIIVQALPRNLSGKVLKTDLRRQLEMQG